MPPTIPDLTTCGCVHFGQVALTPPYRIGDDAYDWKAYQHIITQIILSKSSINLIQPHRTWKAEHHAQRGVEVTGKVATGYSHLLRGLSRLSSTKTPAITWEITLIANESRVGNDEPICIGRNEIARPPI